MLTLDLQAVARRVAAVDTDVLLDWVTIAREGREPQAIAVVNKELHRRGVTAEQIAEHDRVRRDTVLFGVDGTAVKCCRCDRCAVVSVRGWFRLLRLIPLFPTQFAYCEQHRPQTKIAPE